MILSKRMRLAEKEVERIEGKTIPELVKENKKLASDRGWIANMDVIARLLDLRYRWENDWEKFVKLLYAWQKKMYVSYELRKDFFEKEWGVVGDNTLTLLTHIYNAMIYEDVERKVVEEKSTPLPKGRVAVAPSVVLKNEESETTSIPARIIVRTGQLPPNPIKG